MARAQLYKAQSLWSCFCVDTTAYALGQYETQATQSWGQVLDALVTLGIIGWMYKRHLGLEPLRTSWSAVKTLVKAAAPFGLNTLFGSIYLSVDVLLLAVMKGDTEVGVYRGAVMLIALFSKSLPPSSSDSESS